MTIYYLKPNPVVLNTELVVSAEPLFFTSTPNIKQEDLLNIELSQEQESNYKKGLLSFVFTDANTVSINLKVVKTREEEAAETRGNLLIYNDLDHIQKDNFREKHRYGLVSGIFDPSFKADGSIENGSIDNLGYITSLWWYKDGKVAIVEDREYTRTVKGEEPFETYKIEKKTTQTYYKNNGGFLKQEFTTSYNEAERKSKEITCRKALIDKTRFLAGTLIAGKIIAGRQPTAQIMQEVKIALNEAKLFFEKLSGELNVYRNDRINKPLIDALQAYTTTPIITAQLIGFIVSLLNVEFYEKIN